jgi:hypothetical protein
MKRKRWGKKVTGGLHKTLLDCWRCFTTLVVDEKTIRVTCGSCVAQTLWRKAS